MGAINYADLSTLQTPPPAQRRLLIGVGLTAAFAAFALVPTVRDAHAAPVSTVWWLTEQQGQQGAGAAGGARAGERHAVQAASVSRVGWRPEPWP
jgi:hypothetical protein